MAAQILLNGLAMGCIYVLVSLGFVMVIRAAGVINFAHGEWVMLGGYLGVTATTVWGLPPVVALIVTAALMALVGWAFQWLVFFPLRGKHVLTVIMATVGISIALQHLAPLIWGPYPLTMPLLFGTEPAKIAGASILPHTLFVLLFTTLVVLALQLFLSRSSVGLMIQATAQDGEAAQLMGIRVRRMNTFVFCLASALAGAAGFLVAPLFIVTPEMGFAAMLKGLAASILGGWGSLQGAVAGGLFIGLTETFVAAYVSTAYKDAVAFALVIVVLLVSPQGFFGEKVGEKV